MAQCSFHDTLIRDCQYMDMRKYLISDLPLNADIYDKWALVVIITHLIGKEAGINLVKLGAYLKVLNDKFYKSHGEYLFYWLLSFNFNSFRTLIDNLEINNLVHMSINQSLELGDKGIDIANQSPEMLRSINDLLDWILLNGKFVSCVNPIPKRVLNLQKGLDDYFQLKMKTNKGRGDLYEHFIGYLFEKEKYKVQYRGGPGDSGIDVVCKNSLKTYVVQCKNWKEGRKISPKEVLVLIGAMTNYKIEHSDENVSGVFFSTVPFSNDSMKIAAISRVELYTLQFPIYFPVIKCCKANGIYYLPMDNEYDAVEIKYGKGDFYCQRVFEAEKQGYQHVKNQQIKINFPANGVNSK